MSCAPNVPRRRWTVSVLTEALDPGNGVILTAGNCHPRRPWHDHGHQPDVRVTDSHTLLGYEQYDVCNPELGVSAGEPPRPSKHVQKSIGGTYHAAPWLSCLWPGYSLF